MQYDVEQDISQELNERLRMELGWTDVASGLTRVLVGYLVMFLGVVIGVTLVVLSAFPGLFGEGVTRPGGTLSIGSMWLLYIGLGILSIIGTFGYGLIMGGQWSCLQGASERHGARWLMFFCLTTLFAGPGLNAMACIGGGMRHGPDLQRGARTFAELQFSARARYMQLAGATATALYTVLFLLFLRAVAQCHASRAHVTLVNFYLVFVGTLIAITIYVGYLSFRGQIKEDSDPRLWVLGAWGVCLLFYLFLIGSIRACVVKSLNRVRSPLEM